MQDKERPPPVPPKSGFPFKCPVTLMALGLSCLFCGVTFFLIAFGTSLTLWTILGGIFTSFGIVCTGGAVFWCRSALRRAKLEQGPYGKVREYETETVISDPTEAMRWHCIGWKWRRLVLPNALMHTGVQIGPPWTCIYSAGHSPRHAMW